MLPTQTLFGLGQHNAKFLLDEGRWTMFNRDQPGSPEHEEDGKQHLYGTHPFLMFKTHDDKFGGIMFYNSNAQQVNIEFSKSGKSVITYRTIGGILDIYYIMADSADEVIRKYNNLVGKPALPPFWSLGFHQCSWQYNNTEDLIGVVDRYQSLNYPIDTIWSDIMYMDRYIDFTVDTTEFKGIKEYVDTLHKEDMHFVPIVDAGISILPPQTGPNWYSIGSKDGVFIKSTQNPDNKFNGNIIGKVWPNYTAFVDFLHPESDNFWNTGLTELHNLLPFDGLWLDMNEPSNFCTKKDEGSKDDTPIGECYPKEGSEEYSNRFNSKTDSKSSTVSPVKPGAFDKIPFKPGDLDLNYKTLSMDAYFYDDQGNDTFLMYNIHNLYGTLETIATHNYFKSKDNKRQLIISRDSFVGHGQYGSIWTGDNDSTQRDLELSINQIMNFNMFGMPFIGGDVCGFGGKTATATLCARWAQVGAFYPFFRNHYAINKGRQEFYQYDEKYQKGMKEAIRLRYSLLRYMYTCLYKSSAFGDPTIRHPMYDWPGIKELVENENSFMIGPAVRISANFDISDEPKKFSAPFAKGRYLEYTNYTVTEVKKFVEDVELSNGFDTPNIHIREGSIIPFQDASEESGVTKTKDLLNQQLKLLIFPTKSGYAKGNVFIANGETTDEKEQFFNLIHSNKAIQFIMAEGTPDEGTDTNEVVEEIRIVGTDEADTANFACYMTSNQQIKPLKIEPVTVKSGDTKYIRIFGDTNTIEFDQVDTIFYGTKGIDYNYCDKGYIINTKESSPKKKEFR